MLLGIFNTIFTIPISNYFSLINANNRLNTNISAFLIDNKNNSNDCKRDQKDYILAIRYQKIIKNSEGQFLINNVYKHIRFIYFWFFCSIIFIVTFAGTSRSGISIICTSINIFIISLNKNLAHAFFSSKNNICQHINYLKY